MGVCLNICMFLSIFAHVCLCTQCPENLEFAIIWALCGSCAIKASVCLCFSFTLIATVKTTPHSAGMFPDREGLGNIFLL